MVDHVDHWFGRSAVDRFKGVHAFLHQHLLHLQAFFDHRHLVALLAVEAAHFRRVFHRHDAHAVGAGVGFDDDERLVLDIVFAVLGADVVEDFGDIAFEAFLAFFLVEIDLAAFFEIRIDQPRVDAGHLGKLCRDLSISGEVIRLAAHEPARVQRRQHGLFDVTQNFRHAAGEIVVKQHYAGVEALDRQTVAVALQRFKGECRAIR